MSTTLKTTIAAALMAAFSFAPLTAHAQLFSDDEARRAILDLRARLNNMQNEINAKADKTNNLDLDAQNAQLRQEISKLRGQVEVLTNELANTQRRQKDFYVDLDNRLRKIEPQRVTVDGKEVSIQQEEQRAYDAALAFFKAGDYKNAGAAFYDFTRRFPQSGFAPSAQYWLGSTYYAQRDYRNAIAAQQVVVKNYPDNPKAADALLNIASAYMELKDRVSAKRTLETLVAQYPEAPAAETAKERLSALR
ncbi:MAG TPA: tol-pal system protein YbgF [Noviherbaspirillum sp.]|jgi:tol-pal system protein YbgF|uniref:tol-pal system protein YbgF n=1 Tax=Noviherbaspirillum sp. TaxID=1926288 RepID=UPI002DDCDF78|nr:tol-pal system protein YbgF [Noviherbaspirillum sp.]HEV2609417.1 tol-pal system protein YbgF [Noviherbaspirillum sp.]